MWYYLNSPLESSACSLELVVESWEGRSSDGAPSALSRMLPTPETACLPGSGMDASPDFQSGTTFVPSTESHGKEASISSAVGSPAKTSVPQDVVKASLASEAGCGKKWRELSERFDLATSSWRIPPYSSSEDLPWLSVILPRWGMLRGGVLWALTTPEHLTNGTGSGLWRTPTVSCAERGAMDGRIRLARGQTVSLQDQVKGWNWPTPLATDGKNGGPNQKGSKGDLRLSSAVHKFPTPRANDAEKRGNFDITNPRNGLPAAVKMWPAPCASEARQGFQNRENGKKGSQKSLSTVIQGGPSQVVGGSLNPNWVEWLMGWPIGWTSMEPLPKSTWNAWVSEFHTEATD